MTYKSSTAPVAAALLALGASACGGSVERIRACEIDEEALPKAWFLGDGEETDVAGHATIALTITVTEAIFDGEAVSGFVGAVASTTATAEISESFLTFRDNATGQVASSFQIWRHQSSACAVPYDPSQPVDGPPSPPQPPWHERAWFRVDWSTDAAGDEVYAFDEASTFGYPNAAKYHALTVHPPNLDHDLERGVLSFRAATLVTWNEVDDGTKPCAFDLPHVAPEGPCPKGELRLAYELSR